LAVEGNEEHGNETPHQHAVNEILTGSRQAQVGENRNGILLLVQMRQSLKNYILRVKKHSKKDPKNCNNSVNLTLSI
jgi:hypothetical protein